MSDRDEQLVTTEQGQLAVETRFRVRYYETDAMGIVHHASYIRWFEEGRSAFTRVLGYPYSRMEAEGVSLAVAEVNARYHLPARYDDVVCIRAAMSHLGSRGMTFSYEVRRVADGALLVSGSTKHISVDRAGKVVRLGEGLLAAFARPGGD